MIDDLIKELRSYPAHYVAAHRASDVLERIDFYNCRLEDDLVKLEAAAESLREYSSKQALDIVALGQEVGRLREALASSESWISRWAKHVGNCSGSDETCTCGRAAILFEARAALAEKGET